ncbi:hypothetical protein [Arthrobacter cupressi]|uniref:Uncharacterized protein n=1 Tax=Arthrobacter cupressi TaxID=1045773 RepID=A0A1G8M5X5_9MICC|nr:hypothetical protein [Arthrobacter cupressi]NYD79587.1 cytochrome c551/c552 [Arthrobacter cupressi]SDI63295.1 hypothetical protein SAMN05216555_103279 [Arthrobacter cupressi]
MTTNQGNTKNEATTLAEASRAGRALRRPAALTAVLAALYALAGVIAGLSGGPFPVGDGDPYSMALLYKAPNALLGWGLTALAGIAALLATLAAVTANRDRSVPGLRVAVTAIAAVMGLTALVLVGDARLLSVLGYIPVIIAKVAYDPQIQQAIPRLLDPAQLNLVVLAVGAAQWAALAVAVNRRARNACAKCGRSERTVDGPFSAQAAARWGRSAVAVAVFVPLVYAVTRICWAFGIPLGVEPTLLDGMQGQGMDTSALGLGGMAVLGSVLTLGLVQRWGEVFPRWIPRAGGKRVPIGLAVVPAAFVAMAIIPASVTMLMMAGLPSEGTIPGFSLTNWAPLGPTFLWPLWGVALGAATLAYWLRRRGACATCHRVG